MGISAFGQSSSLSLASATAVQGGSVSLALSLNASSASVPAASQWTVQYAPGDITATTIYAGPALTAAGKTLSCASSSGSLTCLTSGLNTNTIANGVVALVNVTLAAQTSAPSVALGLAGTLGALATGEGTSVSGTGGTIAVQGWTSGTQPTAPTNLSTVANVTQVALVWNTSSTPNAGVTRYLVERCQGAGCTTFAQIGTAAGTTYNDSGLSPSTSYSYRVRADAAGSLSPYSNVASATTAADTQPPTAPASVTAATADTSRINLSWTASTDNVGVTRYLVERCQGAGCTTFAQIGTAAGTTYNDNGLSPSTSYSYRVRATDAAGNLSSYSNVTSATTTIAAAAPVITSGTTASGMVGRAFSYQITATNAPTSYEATALPAGLTVNSGTGLISGTPTAAGTWTVTLSATNNAGTGNATLTLTIARQSSPAAP